MKAKFLATVAVSVLVLSASLAAAEPKLIAMGALSGSAATSNTDLSGLEGKLENGAPANMLGGIGSGLAYAGENTFLALPDRGPNAVAFNPKVDDTVSFIPRFDTLSVTLGPNDAGVPLPLKLSAELKATTLLHSKEALVYGSGEGLDVGPGAPATNKDGTFYFSGRSDNFDATKDSCNPANARMDSEGIRVSGDGKSVFISDEYGPYLYQFDRATGLRVKAFALPANLCIAKLSPSKKVEIDGNATGRTTNQGMEGLALTPKGKMLVGNIQSALAQDKGDEATKKMLRLVTVDIASGETHEYGYMLTEGSGVSELLAINDHEFLALERDGKGLGDNSAAKVKAIFKIDLAGAKDITALAGLAAAEAAVKKTKFFDLVPALVAAGVAAEKVPSKIEGIAFGPDTEVAGKTMHTLFISNDNDFLPDTAGPNLLYVVGFEDADLPGLKK